MLVLSYDHEQNHVIKLKNGAFGMDWDKLRIFHAVADAGSLTHAGDTCLLYTSPSPRDS